MRQTPACLDNLRIAVATDTWVPQVNGVSRTLARLVGEARRRGASVRVLTPHDPKAPPDPEVTAFPSRAFWSYPQLRMAWPSRRTVGRVLDQWRPHLVHAATPFGVGVAARQATRARRIPLVTSYHTSFGAYAGFYGYSWLAKPGWSYLRWFHNGGSRTWCPTRAIEAELRGHGFSGTALWSRGVDATAFSPGFRSRAFRRAHGIADDHVLVTYVGRLAREKGLDALLSEVRAAQAGPLPNLRLMLVGDGPHEAACRAAAPPGAVLTGTLSGHELAAAFASADIFAFPSQTDTFGNVMLEAMASGVPVLAADCAVTRELVVNGAGDFFRPELPGDLVRVLMPWAGDSSRRRVAGAHGRGIAESRSWDRVFDQLFEDYLQVLAEHQVIHSPAPVAAAPVRAGLGAVVAHP